MLALKQVLQRTTVKQITVSHAVRAFSSDKVCFSGHNKWSKIKHDKAKNDAEKNKMANKFSNMIAVAARTGGADISNNVRLAAAIEAANKANIQKKVIENAIKRGAGDSADKKQTDEVTYEAVGPAGVSFIIEALTDKKTRVVNEIRAIFNKYGGSLSPSLFNFERKGYVVCDHDASVSEDDLFDRIIESGGEDYEVYANEDEKPTRDKSGNLVPIPDILEITTDPKQTSSVANFFKDHNYKIREVGIAYVAKPDALMTIDDVEMQEKLEKLINALEEIPDITDVYTTIDEK